MLEDDYIINPQKREDIENDILFKFNYGTNMETPSNFKKKTRNEYDYEDLFYNIKYNKEKKIFKQNFAGLYTNEDFYSTQLPDRNTIRGYMKDVSCKVLIVYDFV